MPNVIVVTVEELESLVDDARNASGLSRRDTIKWNKKLEQAEEPTFLGMSDDGMAIYELRFTL